MFGKKNGAPAPAREDAARARPKSKMKGGFRERLFESWVEIRENPGRSTLQALGVVLGVASVLGGFSISDSQRRQAERIFARIGGIDKLNVMPTDTVYDGAPSALQTANLGLRLEDATEGRGVFSSRPTASTL